MAGEDEEWGRYEHKQEEAEENQKTIEDKKVEQDNTACGL